MCYYGIDPSILNRLLRSVRVLTPYSSAPPLEIADRQANRSPVAISVVLLSVALSRSLHSFRFWWRQKVSHASVKPRVSFAARRLPISAGSHYAESIF